MKREKLKPILKWTIYTLLLIILYTLQTTPGLFQLFSIKPVPIVPLIVCISMYEGIIPSAMFSMAAGFLWDISSNKLFGFNALILMFCGMFISLICIYYFHTKILNSMMFCTAVMLIQGILNYIFYYAVWNLDNSWIVFVKNILPMSAYTVLITPLIFLLVRSIERHLSPVERI